MQRGARGRGHRPGPRTWIRWSRRARMHGSGELGVHACMDPAPASIRTRERYTPQLKLTLNRGAGARISFVCTPLAMGVPPFQILEKSKTCSSSIMINLYQFIVHARIN